MKVNIFGIFFSPGQILILSLTVNLIIGCEVEELLGGPQEHREQPLANLELLEHPGASHAVSLHHLVEVGDDQALDLEVEVAIDPAVLHTLDFHGHSAKNPHFVSAKIKFPTLNVRHGEAHLPDEVIVNE